MALYRHTISGTFPGEQFSYGFHSEGSLSVAAAQSGLITGLTNLYGSAYADTVCSDVVVTLARTVELDPATGKQRTGAENVVNHPGTGEAECLPFQCAPVVSLRTAQLNRAGRGRFYAPSLGVDQVAGGRMTTAAQTALADGFAQLLAGITDAGNRIVIYHRASADFDTVVRLDVGDVIDTQRRRRNKLVEARVSRLL